MCEPDEERASDHGEKVACHCNSERTSKDLQWENATSVDRVAANTNSINGKSKDKPK